MPAPLAFSPVMWALMRYGAVAAMAFYASRNRNSEPKDALHEQILDDLPDGVHIHAHRAEAERGVHGHSRLRRTLRFRRTGPGLEIDLSALGRMRLRRVD